MMRFTTRTYFDLSTVSNSLNPTPWYAKENNLTWPDVLGLVDSTMSADTYLNKLLRDYVWPEHWESFICYSDATSTYAADMSLATRGRMLKWINSSKDYYEPIIALYSSQQNHLLDKIETITSTLSAANETGSIDSNSSGLNNNNEQSGGGSAENVTQVDIDGQNEHQGTLTKHNDTPQNSGDFTTDTYATDVVYATTTGGYSKTLTASRAVSATNSLTTTAVFAQSTTASTVSAATSNGSTTAVTVTDATTPIARLKEVRDNVENLYETWAKEFRQFVIFSA